jgi:hypothetical protein
VYLHADPRVCFQYIELRGEAFELSWLVMLAG